MRDSQRPEKVILDGIEELADRLGGLLPPAAAQMKTDFENNAKAMLKSRLEKMDLVTREEFDIQQRVLEKTRQRLKLLEQKLAELEQHQQHQQHKDDS